MGWGKLLKDIVKRQHDLTRMINTLVGWEPGDERAILTSSHGSFQLNWQKGSLISRFMGPTLGRQDPDGPHVGPINFGIWVNDR